MNRVVYLGLLTIVAWGTLSPGIAHAYVDPGTAGFLVTTVLGFLAAVGYTLRSYLHRMKRWFFRKKADAEDDAETPR